MTPVRRGVVTARLPLLAFPLLALLAPLLAALPVLPAPAAAAAPTAPAAPAALADEETGLSVEITSVNPSALQPGEPLELNGTVTNVDEHGWRDVQAYLVMSPEPVTTSGELAEVAASPEETYISDRITELRALRHPRTAADRGVDRLRAGPALPRVEHLRCRRRLHRRRTGAGHRHRHDPHSWRAVPARSCRWSTPAAPTRRRASTWAWCGRCGPRSCAARTAATCTTTSCGSRWPPEGSCGGPPTSR